MLFIVLLSFFLFNIRISSKVSNKHLDEILLTGYIFLAGSIILSGYLLSSLNLWHSKIGWSIIPFLFSYGIYLFFCQVIYLPTSQYKSTFKFVGKSIQQIHDVYKQQKRTEKILFAMLLIGIIVTSSLQFYLFFTVPPNEWDSMTGHLNRILYFNQNHTTGHFIGTNWNIDTYPKSFSSIQFYPFLMTNFNELFFKLPNLLSYWILFLGSHAILKQFDVPFKVRLLSASLILFTPIILVQSTSTDTDIVLASYLVICIYYIFRYIKSKESYYLYLFTFVFAIGLSHKITWIFAVPPIILILIYARYQSKAINLGQQFKHLLYSGIFIILITLPTGYLANIKYYKHPIGPPTATKHQSIERAGDIKSLVFHGTKNVLRYINDLLNFDGLRNISFIESLQIELNKYKFKVDEFLNLHLESDLTFTILPYQFNRQFEFVNGTPIYGAIFIFILLPSIILLFLKKRVSVLYVMFMSFALHFLALAYTAAYDPWKGRYMISSLVFLLPIASLFFEPIVKKNKYVYILPIFLIIILSAWSTLLFHGRAAFISVNDLPTIWNKSRMDMLTISRPDITKAYKKFDELVPEDATVALATVNDDYEYPLWGSEFSRTLIPINPFEKGLQPIPKQASYLFFSKNIVQPISTDIRLGTDSSIKNHIIVPGEDYYLRKLK